MKKNNTLHENGIAEEHFRFYFLTFRNVGVPLTSHSNSKLYSLYSVFIVLCAYSLFVAVFLDLLNNMDDLKHTMQNVQACIGMAVTIWIHISVSLQKNKIVQLMVMTNSFTWEDLPITNVDSETESMTAMTTRIRKTVKQMFVFLTFFHGGYIVIRLIFSEKRVLTVNSFYVLDVLRSPVYELIFLSQIIGTAMYAVMFFGLWGLYSSFIYIACIQLKKLRAGLVIIRQKRHPPEQDSGAETDEDEGNELGHTSREVVRNMHRQLNDCIRHHQQILSYMHAMEHVLSPILLGVFFIATVSICLCGFSTVMNMGNVMAISQAALVYVFMIFLLYTFCQLGEELTRQAESVRDAVWESNWVGTPVSFQHCLIFIIVLAGKKFSLTAGKFVTVSNATMLNIFNQTVSFFMFLLRVKDKTYHHTNSS